MAYTNTPTKVLVTGASGYVASSLIPQLHQCSYSIHGLDKRPTHDSIGALCKSFHLIDCTDATQLAPVLQTRWDAVVHLAALCQVAESVEKPQLYLDTNWKATESLLQNLDYERFIFVSSAAAREPDCSPYAQSKFNAEAAVRRLAPGRSNVVRLYNVVGCTAIKHANSVEALFARLVAASHSGQAFVINGTDYPGSPDQSCVRSLIHVHDVAASLIELLKRPADAAGAEPAEIGYVEPVTVRQFAEAFHRVNRCTFTIKSGPRRQGDIAVSLVHNPAPFMSTRRAALDTLVNMKEAV